MTFILSGASLFLCYEIEGDYYSDLYYNDSKYRLENTERAIMARSLTFWHIENPASEQHRDDRGTAIAICNKQNKRK